MTFNKKISSPNELGGNFTTCFVQDGKILVPIPFNIFETAGVNLNLPVIVAGLDIGGIYIFNPGVQNPDLIKNLIPPLKR